MKYKLAVIGSPIKHSLSPFIHEKAFSMLGIECEYERTEVKEGELGDFINYAKSNGICGFNITMPLKRNVMDYLDEIDGEALLYGAVNTVKITNGKLKGYNTDAEGYKKSLEETGFEMKGKNIVFIGAGGAAVTVALKAAMEKAEKITILNRNISRAENAKEYIFDKTGADISAMELNSSNLAELLENTDLLINATPLGMSGTSSDYENLSFMDSLKKDALVSDFIYNPPETKFLKYAKELELKTINGLGMLIYQGIISDGIYLEKELDYKKLKDYIASEYIKANIQLQKN